MRRSYFITSIAAVAVLLCSAALISAQVGQLRGTVRLIGADGQPAPVAGATIDVFRTDLSSEYHTKSEKNGDWVFAGLPYVGTYIVAISAPGAQANAKGGVKAGREIPVDVILAPGDGKRLTLEEAKEAVARGSSSSSGGGESAADKARREEMLKKGKELDESNKKNANINQAVGDAFKAGNAALNAKNYDEALKQYDIGLAADADQPTLLTNKTLALKARGVDKYNVAIKIKDDDASKASKAAGLESAKADFKAAIEAANKAAELSSKMPAATDPNDQKQQALNKYATLTARAEAYRLFVTKADASQADAGAAAFDDYIAVETDPAKKAKAQMDKAQLLFDAGAADKAIVEFKKILDAQPDNVDALYGIGICEISVAYGASDKVKMQEGVNYLQQFVDKAPDAHRYKAEAKATLAELKSTENVVPEKTTPSRRKRP
jgi:tetratricopeptide (TPR) repeat protein